MDALKTLLQNYDVLAALWMTIKLTLFSALGAVVLGTLVAICRISPVAVLRGFAITYVGIVRNTPLTLIIFFCAFGVASTLGVTLAAKDSATFIVDNNFRFGLVALSIYHASFVAEALRSGINTVPQGQAEASRAIGLGFTETLREVILPQAYRGAIAPLGSTLIALTKNPTVVATIGVAELAFTMRGMIEFNGSLLYAIFVLIAACFVILTLPTGLFFTRLSRRLVVQR